MRILTDREFSTLAAVADVILPGGDGYPTAREAQIAESTDGALVPCHPAIAKEVKQDLALPAIGRASCSECV